MAENAASGTSLSDVDGTSFDVIVLGAGPVGENVADRVVRGGLTCAVVETDLAGGECSYWACIPSKALLKPIEQAAAASRLPGVRVEGVDVAAVLKHRDSFVSRTDDGGHDDSGQAEWLSGITTFVRGWGRLAGEKTVEVTGDDGTTARLTANSAVVVATGSTATLPDLPGLRDAKPWGSRDVTNLESVPDRTVILGGGVVAVESATALQGLGSTVTVLARSALLPAREPWAGEMVADALRHAGADIVVGADIGGLQRDGDGPVTVTYTVDGQEKSVTADEVVAALGRRPNSGDIGLDTVGLEPGKPVEVDDTLRSTTLDWLYAVGDVTGRVQLTHQGKYEGRICADVIVGRTKGEIDQVGDGDRQFTAYADHRMVPQVVFSDPQVASVGLTEAQARDAGFDVKVVEYDIGSIAGAALEANGYTGKANLVVDEARSVPVGATFVGQNVAELLHSATIAVVGEVPMRTLWHAVPSFPTISEVWLRLMEAYGL